MMILSSLLSRTLLAAVLILQGQAFPAKWVIPKNEQAGVATVGAPAYAAYEPAGGAEADSCWTFHIPVRRLAKGTDLEFDFTVQARKGDAENYRAEYFDGRRWVPLKHFQAHDTQAHPVSELIGFRLGRRIRKELRLRILPLPTPEERASGKPVRSAHLAHFGYTAASVQVLPEPAAPMDTLRVLVIGNSNTYYNFSASLMKEIAWSQGHCLDIEMSVKGGQTFAQHLGLQRTNELIALGGYDLAILQNNTIPMTTYGMDPEGNRQLLDDCVALVGKIRAASPDCRILVERGWAYSAKNFGGAGSWEGMDNATDRSSRIMAETVGGAASPIGNAALRIRTERPDLDLYQSDHSHPSLSLSYLKACVNYLMILRMTSSGTPAFHDPVPDCGVDPALAAWLRTIALETVLQ